MGGEAGPVPWTRTLLGQVDGLDRTVKAWTGNLAQMVDLTPTTLGHLRSQRSDQDDPTRA